MSRTHNKSTDVHPAVNFVDVNKASLGRRHYILRSPKHPRRWAAFATNKVRKYRELWGDDFCLVIVGDPAVEDDFYAIPWNQVSDLFIDDNAFPVRAKNGKVTRRWQIHLQGPPHEFQLEFAKDDSRTRPRFNASAWYGNREALLAESPVNLLDRVSRSAEVNGDFDVFNQTDARKLVATTIVRRQGQPAFRRRLLEIYRGTCAFSGCRVPHILDAAHILPYNGPKTNHPQNGLLLRTDLHTLFDLGLLAVDAISMTIITAESLQGTEYTQFSGKKISIPSDPLLAPSSAALAEHRRLTCISRYHDESYV